MLKPPQLDSAINAAQQHYAYGPEEDDLERLTQGAAKMAWRIGGNQVFQNGNKRSAIWLTRHMLDQNGLGHLSPLDQEDPEFADHMIAQDKYGAHTPPEQMSAERDRLEREFLEMWRNRYYQGGMDPNYQVKYPEGTYLFPEQQREANILDPIQRQLDPSVFNKPDSPRPVLRPEHTTWITKSLFELLDNNGYDSPQNWLSIVLTGSLTTYQYSDHSDCDVSLWINTTVFPDWSRAEMIGLMIEHMDGKLLPGTTHPMQDFVVSPKLTKDDLYKPGMRSAYVIYGDNAGQWLVPPERERVHDVEHEENEAYTIALENADKMEHLLRYEPDKAVMFWHQIHKRRMRDMNQGRGDYSPSNITYKFLSNRGLFPRLEEVSGEHIA